MEKIVLTKTHKEMLETMVEDLFPECEFLLETCESNTYVNINGEQIHWFEFCLINLSKKIADSYDTVYPKEKHAFIVDLLIKKLFDFSYVKKSHPVEYLYDAYKKTTLGG